MAIDHDRLFKELIQTFFGEFMALFFREAYEAIDFEHVTFLSEEVFTDVVAGERRRIDLLIDTILKGEAVMIIVHKRHRHIISRKWRRECLSMIAGCLRSIESEYCLL